MDNEIAVQNLTRLAGGKGLKLSAAKQDERHFVVTLEAGAAPAAAVIQPQSEPVCAPDSRSGVVAAIGSAVMGAGSDELGRVLMKGFLFALTQLPHPPRAVLFYNGGAHLTVEGSDSVEDLKLLEAQGVEVLTCGTCLNFYGLSEKLAVGGVTNMYSIAEALSGAAHVIRP
ncbi:hypothetical protein SDC9_206533 [bioreactor metagenome]|uniref:Uncharacterized protein n=1 Tax=bioreactor metagenome TaxID=1076179 RepID=A0A645J597_9ZZZZ